MKNKTNFTSMLLNKYTIVINLISLLFIILIYNLNFFESLFGALFVLPFFGLIYFLSLIHSLLHKNIKERVAIALGDSFPVAVFFLFRIFYSFEVADVIAGIAIFYLIPILLIATISTFLQYLYKRFLKK